MSGPSENDNLTDAQFGMVATALSYPVILDDRAMKVTARSLEKRGYGSVENGASGQVIFRLNQQGHDAMAWLVELRSCSVPSDIADPWDKPL